MSAVHSVSEFFNRYNTYSIDEVAAQLNIDTTEADAVIPLACFAASKGCNKTPNFSTAMTFRAPTGDVLIGCSDQHIEVAVEYFIENDEAYEPHIRPLHEVLQASHRIHKLNPALEVLFNDCINTAMSIHQFVVKDQAAGRPSHVVDISRFQPILGTVESTAITRFQLAYRHYQRAINAFRATKDEAKKQGLAWAERHTWSDETKAQLENHGEYASFMYTYLEMLSHRADDIDRVVSKITSPWRPVCPLMVVTIFVPDWAKNGAPGFFIFSPEIAEHALRFLYQRNYGQGVDRGMEQEAMSLEDFRQLNLHSLDQHIEYCIAQEEARFQDRMMVRSALDEQFGSGLRRFSKK